MLLDAVTGAEARGVRFVAHAAWVERCMDVGMEDLR